MAKRAMKVNKSEAVREYVKANPAVKPKDAASAISKQVGIAITPAFVSQVKTLVKKRGGKGRGRKGRQSDAIATASNDAASSVASAIKAGRELLLAAGSASLDVGRRAVQGFFGRLDHRGGIAEEFEIRREYF